MIKTDLVHLFFTCIWIDKSSYLLVCHTEAKKLSFISSTCHHLSREVNVRLMLMFPCKAFDSRYWWQCESQPVWMSLIILVMTQMNKERLDAGFCHRLIRDHTRASSSDYVPTGTCSTENRHCVSSISVGTCWVEDSVKQRLSIW